MSYTRVSVRVRTVEKIFLLERHFQKFGPLTKKRIVKKRFVFITRIEKNLIAVMYNPNGNKRFRSENPNRKKSERGDYPNRLTESC